MSDSDDRSSPRFDALWQTVVSDDADLQDAMRRVAETGRAVLIDCDSASVTIIERGRPVTVGSTNETAQTLDDAQYSAGDGPCLTAATEGRTIRIDDIDNDERWPRFAGDRPGQRHPQLALGADRCRRCGRLRWVQLLRHGAGRLQRRRRAAQSGLRRTGVDRRGQRPGVLGRVRAFAQHGQGDGIHPPRSNRPRVSSSRPIASTLTPPSICCVNAPSRRTASCVTSLATWSTRRPGVTMSRRLDDARRQLGLSTMELWVDYFALGGILTPSGSTAICAATVKSVTPTATCSSTP